MSGDDIVDLVIVTSNQNFLPVIMTRKQASQHIKDWFDSRERLRTLKWWKHIITWISDWGRPYTIVFNHQNEQGEWFGYWAVNPKHILGWYIRERQPPINHEELIALQKKYLEAAVREANKGNEWKNEDDD